MNKAKRYNWISVDDCLPPIREYVLARHNRGTWYDSDDQDNVNCVVVKLVKGITEEEREQMKRGEIDDPKIATTISGKPWPSPRSSLYGPEDQHGNNRKPYYWSQFGPDQFFGQSITHWMLIPKLK